MRGRLITNMILQLLSSILFILFISNFVKNMNDVVGNYSIYNHGDLFSFSYSSNMHHSFSGKWTIYLWLWITINLPTLIMGIITLAMKKDPKVKGLTIASGILGILSGGFFSGFIVSLIAVIKTSGNSSKIEPITDSKIEQPIKENIKITLKENDVPSDESKNEE